MRSELCLERAGLLHRLDARVKTAGGLLYILCVALAPPAPLTRFLVFGGMLLTLVLLSGVPPLLLLQRAAPVFSFVAIAALGLLLGGPPQVFWSMSARVLLGTLAVLLLTATTPFPQIAGALRWMRVPGLFVSLLSLTYRYLSILLEEGLRTTRAFQCRAIGGRTWHNTLAFGRAMGALAARAFDRSERIAWAMLARGFDGVLPVIPLPPLGIAQGVGLLMFALMLGLILCWGR